MLMGDFNEVSHSSEKFGGRVVSMNRCVLLNNMMTTCGLSDLGKEGPAFTWCNTRHGLARIPERLDRVLANSSWRLLFPEASVKHLPRLHSDHCPLLLQCEGKLTVDRSKRPFCFQAMWTAHDECKQIVESCWDATEGSAVEKGVGKACKPGVFK
ncbi:Unknown protein [Striga hermonthica]|uniref:Uncharacterized protein n=1 Tax=Striga hermonthica TaxID=68872 RepID=A0A9N7RM29_STRHE|nr:Unknown protein [Striga hermonthica]